MEIRVDVRASGPVYDGAAQAAVHDFLEHALDDIATEGRNLVVGRLVQVIRHPTPYYWTQIHTERAYRDRIVTDGGIVYGPWLEGTGSRNRTTRFKGYATFRQMTQRLAARAGGIAEAALPPYLKRMN